MPHKQLLFHAAAREKILRGATALTDAVQVTLGPKSKSVLIGRAWGRPVVCNDGVSIAKEMSLKDPEEDVGAQIIREAAERTGEAVGDGTTTSTVLAHAIFADGLRNIAAGASAVDLRRGLERGLRAAIEAVRSLSRPVQSRQEKVQVATIAAHNDAGIGELNLGSRSLDVMNGGARSDQEDAQHSGAAPAGALGIPPAEALAVLRWMLLIRRFEERCAEMYSLQKIRGFLHLYIGEEAVVVGAMRALEDDDAVVAAYRDHGHALLRGVSPASAMAEMYGKATGCARGRGGSMHLFCAERRFYGGYAIVAGGLPIAVGLALADKLAGRRRVTAVFFGDGATDEGEFHESLNLAALWILPVLFLCENNRYAMGTALERHAANPRLIDVPAAHLVPAEQVDGMDVLAVEQATRRAAAAVREGARPRFLELQTYRFRAHSMYDAEKYRDRSEVAAWRKRDPIDLFVARLRAAGLLGDDVLARIKDDVATEVEAAVQAAEQAPLEPVEDLTRFIYAREVP